MPGPSLSTRVTSLSLNFVPNSHTAAVEEFVNTFAKLVELNLHFWVDSPPLEVGPRLRLPLLRALDFHWELPDPEHGTLSRLDLRTLPALESFAFSLKGASADFVFHLPSSIKMLHASGVPLPALISLFQQAPDQLPALRRAKLDVPNGINSIPQQGETVNDVVARGVNGEGASIHDWVGYTPECLDKLFRLAKQRGVKITGSVVHIHAYSQAKLAQREQRAARRALRLAAAEW